MLKNSRKGMPTVMFVVGLVSTLLVGSAMLGSLQAIKSTSLDPNVDRTQDSLNQVGDKVITISASDSDTAKKQMQGAIIWNMMTASDCRVMTATHMISSTVISEDGEEVHEDIQIELPDSDVSLETEGAKGFKLANNQDFLEHIAGNKGNGYVGRFTDFQPLINSGFDTTCTGTSSAVKQIEDQVQNAQSDLAGKAVSGLVGIGTGAVAIAACGTGVGCIAVAAIAGGASYMASDASGVGDAMGGFIVPGADGDIGSEPGFDMEGVFSRMEFNVEKSFLMGASDPRSPLLATGFKFDKPDNTPGFWRGKRFSYLLPAGLNPESFNREDHEVFASGAEVDGILCLDDYSGNCVPFTETGSGGQEPGGLFVLNQIYGSGSFTLSDPEALQVVNQRIEWILNNKDLFSEEPNVRLQQRLEGIESKGEFTSEVRADSAAGRTRGMSLTMLFGNFVVHGSSIGESTTELMLEEGETLPDDFPDDDVSGKYSLVDRGSGGASLARAHFEDTAPGTQQEKKKMMFYSFRPRMENVPVIAGERLTEDRLTQGCSDCTDMDRLKNMIRHTSYLFCEGVSGRMQSNAGHIFSSDEATSQDGTLEDQVYPKVEITDNATGCIPTTTISVPDDVNLDCSPEDIVADTSVQVFSRQTADRGLQTVDVVCGTEETEESANLGSYGRVSYRVAEETLSREGCYSDWYDITSDSYIKGGEVQTDAPTGVQSVVDNEAYTLANGDYPMVLYKNSKKYWSHDYDTRYNDDDGQDEIGGDGENNRINYERISVEYNTSTVENLTYRISMRGVNSGDTNGMLYSSDANRTIIVEERPNSSETIIRQIVESPGIAYKMREVTTTEENFSGSIRELVVDRTSEGGVSINGAELADFEGFPEQIAVTELEISPVRNANPYNREYDWGRRVSDLEPTQTDFELRKVKSYSKPRVCKGQRGVWQSRGKEVIGGE